MNSKPLPADPMIRELVRHAQKAQLNRRTLLTGAAVGASGLALAACTTGSDEITAATDESDTNKKVRWDNWALYVDVDDAGNYPTIDAFEAQTGISVEYTEAVDDNNTYYGKVKDQLSLGRDIGADAVVLTDWMIARLIRFGYTQKLDYANMPNVANNLLPSLQDVDFDPGREMSVPWQGGFAGIAWNKEQVPNGIKSVQDLWKPELKGRVGALSEMRDTMGLIMLDQGVDISGDWGDDEFNAAIEEFSKQVADGQIRNIKGNSYKEDLVNEDTLAAIVWSGDIVQLNAENGDKWDFVVPDAGGTLWNDNFMVPIGSPAKSNVEELINYYYDPAVAAEVAAYVNYITPVAGAKEAATAIDPALADNKLIFPDDDTLSRAFVFRGLDNSEEQKYNAAFQSVLLGAA